MVIFPTVTHSVGSYLGPKGEELKCTLHSEEQCEHPVEVAQDFSEVKWSSMKLKLDKMVNLNQSGLSVAPKGVLEGKLTRLKKGADRQTFLDVQLVHFKAERAKITSNCFVRYSKYKNTVRQKVS